MHLEQYEDAIKEFDQAIQLNQKDETTIYNRAAIQAQLDAKKVFEERLGSLVDTKELEEQSEYYKTLHDDLRKQIGFSCLKVRTTTLRTT